MAVTKPLSLLSRIYRVLEKRPDVRILSDDDDRITGVQLRRVWESYELGDSPFARYEKQRWHYYGQAFVIEEAVYDRKKGPDKEQQVRLAHLAAVGTLCIIADAVSDVEAALGPVPGNFGDYLKRLVK